jgi:hypothetical protein
MQNSSFAGIRNARVNNWRLKLVSLVLAILTFYAIRGATSFEIPVTVPLVVEVEKGIAILDQPGTVEVTFCGSQADLRALDRNRIRAVVRPKTAESSGSERVPVREGNIKGASGVRVTRVVPEIATIAFDHEIEKVFRILKPRAVGTPLGGKVEIDYEPQYAKISGPKRWLQDREVVETEPVDVGGCTQSFSKRVRVLSPGETGVTRIEPSEITVKINIVTESVSREWTNIPVRAVLEAGNTNAVTFNPSSVTVTLHGRDEVLRKISGDSVTAFVDCVGFDTSDIYDLPVSVHLPPAVDMTATIEPPTVKVFFGTPQL